MSKLKLAVIYGGQSTEHDISIKSATSIVNALDRSKYEISLIKIDKDGTWNTMSGDAINTAERIAPITLVKDKDQTKIFNLTTNSFDQNIDIAFPVLHGMQGEDGTIQGLFRMLDLAFVGCDVFASSACSDKDYCKRLLQDQGIEIAPYRVAYTWNKDDFDFTTLKKELGTPMFLKPANLGSSVGVHKVNTEEEYNAGLADAFKYDNKVLIEKNIEGIEVECAVLGNEAPKASILGAIIPSTSFYSFESKYEDADGALLQMPAEIETAIADKIRKDAVKAYRIMNCEGLSRVDFFLTKDGQTIINEINTIPGFTSISMYPKLWELSGLPYVELLDCLIDLGMERSKR